MCLSSGAAPAGGQNDPRPADPPAAVAAPDGISVPADEQSTSPGLPGAGSDIQKRTELNLLGKTDTARGESRRNENIQFNLVDNNALKELNIRLGISATIIEEFQPERGYFGAEYGNPPSSALHVSAPSASGFHGRLYETHQNSVFSARSFFQAGDVQPAHDNDYGFAAGGKPWRGAQLFADGSQQKLRGQVNGNVLVPKPDERTPLAADPRTRAIVERYLAAYPAALPNRTDVNERALNTNAPQRIDNNNASGRFEQSLGDRDRVYLQYALTTQSVDAFQLVAGQNPDTNTKSHRARLTWDRVWSAATVTDLSAGFDRIRSDLRPEENAVGTYVSVGGALESLGPAGAIPINRSQNMFRYAGRVRHTRGGHSLNAGFEVLRRQFNGLETDVHRGFTSFANDFGRDAITNLRLGTPTQHIISIGDVYRGFRSWELQFFAGDKWSVTPELTLDFSLRHEPVTRPFEVNDRNTIPYGCDCNNFAPRFGFAYRLPQRWGVLRGAYGLQYGQIYPVTFQQVRFAPPGNRKIVVPNPDLADPLRDFDGSDPNIRPTTFELDPELATPYSHHYNFSWEFEVGRNANLQLGYVGSRSHKLLLMWYLNRAHAVEGVPQTSGTLNIRRPVDGLADIRHVVNGSIGYFDAARASFVVADWNGLSLNLAYWLSKGIDLGSAYTNTAYEADSRVSRSQSEFDQFRDMKALSDFDQPHALLWRTAYRTPELTRQNGWWRRAFGSWNLAAIVLLKTGTPFSVTSGSDSPGFGNVDGNGGDRPNLAELSVLGRTVGNPDTSRQLLPRGAFPLIQPTDPAGNLGRNTFRKGSIRNVNASISRTWTVASEKRLTFRAESINLFNTPQFAEPGSFLANANFGQITNTLNDGRTFRFLLEFAF